MRFPLATSGTQRRADMLRSLRLDDRHAYEVEQATVVFESVATFSELHC